jgi:hypothetical protein
MRAGEIEPRSRAPFFPTRVSIAHNSIVFIVSRAGRDNSRRVANVATGEWEKRETWRLSSTRRRDTRRRACHSPLTALLACNRKSAAARPDPSSWNIQRRPHYGNTCVVQLSGRRRGGGARTAMTRRSSYIRAVVAYCVALSAPAADYIVAARSRRSPSFLEQRERERERERGGGGENPTTEMNR